MARNMDLPIVEADGDVPYVMATTYPNGPVCVATEGRVKPEDEWYYPLAKVEIKVKDVTQTIGIFGYYKELVIIFPESLENIKSIYAQDLLDESSVDIKSRVKITGNSLIISGELIKEIGLSAGDDGDISAPAMVIKLSKE